MAQVFGLVFKTSLAFLVAFSSAWVSARSLSDLDAVDQASLQRTLSMRIAKAYIQMAANVDYQKAETELDHSIVEFEYSLNQLEMNSPNSKLHQRIKQVQSEWLSFRSIAETTPNVAQVEDLIEEANDLLYQTDALVREWKMRLPGEHGMQMDLASQQSMLSERIGAYYVAGYLGLKEDWMAQELEQSISAYEQGMISLRGQEDVHPSLMAQLNSNWEYAKMGLSQFKNDRYVPVVIAVTMESMYEQTNTLGAAYHVQERLAMNGGVAKGLAANMAE